MASSGTRRSDQAPATRGRADEQQDEELVPDREVDDCVITDHAGAELRRSSAAHAHLAWAYFAGSASNRFLQSSEQK